MKSLFKIFTIFTPKQLRTCAFIVAAMVVGAMLEAVGIGAILPLISIMGQPDFLSMHPIVAAYAAVLGITNHTQFVMACAGGLIVVYVIKNAYIAWETKLQIDFAIKNQIYYSGQLLANYLAKPYLYHLDHNSATLLRNVNGGGLTAFSYILIPTFTLFTELITAIVIWMMLVLVDFFTAVIVAGLMAVMLYAILRASHRAVSRQGVIQNACAAKYYKWLNQGLGAIKETKVMGKENFFLEQFQQAYMQYGRANGKFLFLNQLPRMLIETLVVSGLLLLIACKLMMGTPPMGIVPLLGVLALAAFRLMPSANRIVNVSNGIKFQLPLFEELYGEFREIRQRRLERKTILLEGRQNKLSFRQQIDIQELQFSYPESSNAVFTGVSFQIPKGKFVGVIGPSGAGKTTFVDILLGLLQPVKGKILVDGIDIQQDIRAWQANLAYVPQSIYLIDGTIRENIALGTQPEKIDDAQVERVLQMAELYDFIQTLPQGLYTPVGERGVKLSGGQRQRIGIARALYQQPEVLILDEATSALDNETEKSITDTILHLKGQITILAIAHRVSTLEGCDFRARFADGCAEIVTEMEKLG
jgi:ATP-binding cassette, subfamily B, bacterial PglK